MPGTAKLRPVHPNRVFIDRPGKLENLYFPESADRSGIPFTADEKEPSTPATQQAATPSPSRAPASATSDEQRREEIRRRLEQLRERLRNNN
mgnify:FL=1